jgi:DNA polymerase-1
LEKEDLMEKVRPIAQIHDELIFEIEENLMEKISPKIKEIMENILIKQPIDNNLKIIPLIVDPKVGDNWSELK